MKKLCLLLPVLIFCINALAQDTVVKKPVLDYWERIKAEKQKIEGQLFQAFNVKTKNASAFTNADIAGKAGFINFWFASCTPCIAEMPGLNQMYEQLRGNKDFAFVSFTYEPDSVIEKCIKKYNIKYPVFHISKEECKRLNFNNGFPTTFILDKNGVIQFFTMGGITEEEGATEDIMQIFLPKIKEQLSAEKEKALPNKTK